MLALRPYQEIGRDFLAARKFALLADEMRVGKTPQAILAAAKIGARTATVICPAIARQQWQREWARWGGPGKVEVLSYEQADRTAWETRDVLIVDEAHYCKNPAAQRTKKIWGKDGLARSSVRTWALTGTPAPNHAAELYVMMKCFGIVKCTYDEFIRYFCHYNWETRRVVGTKRDKIPELRALLDQFMLRRKRRDVAPEMPDIAYDLAPVRGDFRALGNLPDDLSAELEGLQLALDSMAVGEQADWLGKHAADFQTARRYTALGKVAPLVERTDDMMREGTIKQTVIFGFFVDPLELARDKLQERGRRVGLITGSTPDRKRNIMIEQFRLGLLDVMCANILAAGTAIDLSAASYGQFLELDWVVGNNVQAANRLVSMQDQKPVSMDVLTWAGSSDEAVQSTLARKAGSLKQLFA